MKRKADTQFNLEGDKTALKKRVKTVPDPEVAQKSFRDGLFTSQVLHRYTEEYSNSVPYKHGVIDSLINDDLLRSVRKEIRENVHFTPKETDIYKIHQSGDLANLDGLEDAALEKLPSLLRLRDALYSPTFRKFVATVTGSGDLSGCKTDMAINVYTPGCHLLCHDDVIGSRRVSYILYLTDPDTPWRKEWGGALRLFPTNTFEDDTGERTKTPSPYFTKTIPPAWNQLSFFAVQPGESFHDVEEVYHANSNKVLEQEGGRIRMAISGWYHIPQIGEDGYINGAEEKWGANSSLMQLKGNPDRYDFPQSQSFHAEETFVPGEEKALEESDIDFLLKYLAPTYLTPDTLEQISERFSSMSSVTLDGLLSKRYISKVREYIESRETLSTPETSEEFIEGSWETAKPPHKHRYLYKQPSLNFRDNNLEGFADLDPITELLEVFLPSSQFRKWLQIATECEIENYDILARRFRRGLDYALATSHDGSPRLEINLGLTPTLGWAGDESEERYENHEPEGNASKDAVITEKQKSSEEDKLDDVGGHEVYMATDDDKDHTDAAIYQSSSDLEEDNVLFTMPASWNKMSIVLRDSGVLKFVKYVSKSAKGDRWDIGGSFGVKEISEPDDEYEHQPGSAAALESSESEEAFNGFSDSEGDSESD